MRRSADAQLRVGWALVPPPAGLGMEGEVASRDYRSDAERQAEQRARAPVERARAEERERERAVMASQLREHLGLPQTPAAAAEAQRPEPEPEPEASPAEGVPGVFALHVHPMTGGSATVLDHVRSSQTVGEIKELIAAAKAKAGEGWVAPERQLLLFGKDRLDQDEKTLSVLGIGPDSRLQLASQDPQDAIARRAARKKENVETLRTALNDNAEAAREQLEKLSGRMTLIKPTDQHPRWFRLTAARTAATTPAASLVTPRTRIRRTAAEESRDADFPDPEIAWGEYRTHAIHRRL